MRFEYILCALIVMMAVISARLLQDEGLADADGEKVDIVSESKPQKRKSHQRRVRIPAAANHQYYVTGRVNNRSTNFLIDTGASFVALRETALQRAGVLLRYDDFRHPISTANGHTKAARVTLDRLEIDGLTLYDVDAFVLPDKQLDINLLGMSFLSRISSVETRNGEMILTE